jgi:hypothetical protein
MLNLIPKGSEMPVTLDLIPPVLICACWRRTVTGSASRV